MRPWPPELRRGGKTRIHRSERRSPYCEAAFVRHDLDGIRETVTTDALVKDGLVSGH
jgi:hypothetical protein